MRRFIFGVIAAVIMLVVMIKQARANTCDPAYPDIRYGIVMDGDFPGAWAYWWCIKDGVAVFDWRLITADEVTPALITALKDYSQGRNPDFIHSVPGSPDNPKYNNLKHALSAAIAADTGKPVVSTAVWRTPASGGALFTAAGGKITGLVSGRRASGNALCDATVPAIPSGAGVYLPLIGGNAGEVTQCSKVPQ